MITAKELRKVQSICDRQLEIEERLQMATGSREKEITYDCFGQPLSQHVQKLLREAGYTIRCSFSKAKVWNDRLYNYKKLNRWRYTIGW